MATQLRKKRRPNLRIKPRFYFFIIIVFLALIFTVYSLLQRGKDNSLINVAHTTIKDFVNIELTENDIYTGDLILVNNQYAYSSSNTENLVSVYDYKKSIYLVKDAEVKVDKRIVEAFNTMIEDFYSKTGLDDVMVISGFRSKERQAQLYQEELDSTAEGAIATVAMAGYSEHETGLALDLGLEGDGRSFDGEDGYSWLVENCYNYGLLIRYPDDKIAITGIDYEPWHLRYVGLPHSTYMKEKNICLEEYIELLKNYTYDGDHVMVSGMEIYYVPSTGETTQVPVPKDIDYTVSGNNIDGFIVTIAKQG